jgi:predicted Ser/Thr protein kinase
MDTTRICSSCGKPLAANAPKGLCPECLMKAGFPTGSQAEIGNAGHQKPSNFTPPKPAELACFFPQLEILELLGRGGMGAVYKARQKQLDRLVALKILPPSVSIDPAFADRFAREAKALARLNHPNIVTLYEFGRTDGLFYFLMEFVDGVNLRQLLNAGRIAPREALAIVPQICDALQYAHDHSIVHRDIKPENILLDRAGRVKVADFGLAKLVGGDAPETAATGMVAPVSPAPTEAGQVIGTPQYMAPEQNERPQEVDHRADIYSLGVVFYQMLTGELPARRIEPPSRKVQVDVRLDEVVLRALEKEPERRYQQASVLKTEVETIAGIPQPGSAGAPTANQTPAHDFWRYLKYRIWPPLVVRRNGQRVINWPALAMRAIRSLFLALAASLFFGVAFGSHFGHRAGLFTGTVCFGAICILLCFVVAIRLLRGFAIPLDLLPELDSSGDGHASTGGWKAVFAPVAVAMLLLAIPVAAFVFWRMASGFETARLEQNPYAVAAKRIRNEVGRQLREAGAGYDDLQVTVAEYRDSATPFVVSYKGLRDFKFTYGGQHDPKWPSRADGHFIMQYIGGGQWQGALGDTKFTVAVGSTDNIDLPFVNDPQVIGEWESVDFVANPVVFDPHKPKWRSGGLIPFKLTFLENGKTSRPWYTWTKGVLIHHGDKTAEHYDIQEIKGRVYMFLEWKSGDVTIAGMKPQYSVLRWNGNAPGGEAAPDQTKQP